MTSEKTVGQCITLDHADVWGNIPLWVDSTVFLGKISMQNCPGALIYSSYTVFSSLESGRK